MVWMLTEGLVAISNTPSFSTEPGTFTDFQAARSADLRRGVADEVDEG